MYLGVVAAPYLRLPVLTLCSLLLCSTGCPDQVLVETPRVDQLDDVATCKVAKDPLNPLIVEWPGTSKVALDSTAKRGLVIVSYAGCVLKVLPRCAASGRYGFTGVTPARDTLRMSTESDLYARLPLGAASLKGELAAGTALALDYIAVGERRAEGAPDELVGDCEGATHYIASMTLGAYALDAVASGAVSGGVEVQGAGIGGGRREEQRRIRGSGELDKCEGQAPADEGAAASSGCGAILQIGLSPLRGRPVPATVEAGPAPARTAPARATARDTDGDGIPDTEDRCPKDAEDKDAFEDEDGCPDPDNDRDGVADAADKCPNLPETKNGFEDDDGCPDERVAGLRLPDEKGKDKVELARGVVLVGGRHFEFTRDKITFDEGKTSLGSTALGLVAVVASYLQGAGNRLRVEVAVHSDNRGGHEANMKLTQDRANAIRSELIKAGVAKERIQAAGYGGTRPVHANSTDEGRAKNRRVEILILSDAPPPGAGS